MLAWAIVPVLLAASAAQAAVICQTRGGTLKVREVCRTKETVADPVALGLKGPKGDLGEPGPMGLSGPAGPAGAARGDDPAGRKLRHRLR